jgi:adenosylmethionine-8-amino-7-oxononanoate aminotransferase
VTTAYPDGHLFPRHLRRAFPRVVRGEGCWLFDDEGRRYLDACGGAFVASIGHGNAEVAEAIACQARQVAYVNGTAFANEPAEALADELAALAPGDLDRAYFLSSGSEAVEAALKLARQYWVECGRPGKYKILALSPAYHGNTLLALSASAREHYRHHFGEWLVDVRRVPAPYTYRCACGGGDPPCPACSGDALEAVMSREGAETIAAFIAEPVGGSSTGATVPPAAWHRRVRELCDRHEILFVADEILCGAGRTGTWSALEPSGVVPDLMTLGKGIAGGYVPLSVVMAPTRIVDVLARGSGALLHAQTFSHHPVACAAGCATLRVMREHALVARCAAMGRLLHERLAALRTLPHVGDVRGRGLLAGIELVEDRATRTPFPRSARAAETLTEGAQEAGLVVWPNVGQADGTNGDLVMVAPPYTVSEAEIEEIVVRLAAALEVTLERLHVQIR